MKTILTVDDEPSVREFFVELLNDKYNIKTAASGSQAIKLIQKYTIHLVILDVRMSGMDGTQTLKVIKKKQPKLPVIMVTANKDVDSAVDAMKLGASDYIIKPIDIDEIKIVIDKTLKNSELEQELVQLREEVYDKYKTDNIIGESAPMKKIYSMINKIKDNDSTILIRGESGTGKELVAKSIHYNGRRRTKPFIAVNSAAIPETLVESVLFGHEKGSFTGATTQKIGKFEQADTGTIFLDEIGTLRPDVQAKLLRVLQEREVERVGGSEIIPVDVRVIAATNIDIEKAVETGEFREDLYYRLNVVPIHIPPLRQRKEDILPLIEYWFEKLKERLNKKKLKIDKKTIQILANYDWPGNVRELINALERLVVMSTGNRIKVKDMGFITENDNGNGDVRKNHIILQPGMSLEEVEKMHIEMTLNYFDYNKTQVADVLDMTRKTLRAKIKKYKLED